MDLDQDLNSDCFQKALKSIANGGLAVFPTETVYGVGADARNEDACRRIFSVKRRPLSNPLIVHVKDIEQADLYAHLNPLACRLFENFSPGPLSVVLPPRSLIAPSVRANQDNIALRIPEHPLAREFIQSACCPIAAPSANLSGEPSATTYEMAHRFAKPHGIPVIRGECRIGLESTVVVLEDDHLSILRQGSITAGALQEAVSVPVREYTGRFLSPGRLGTHYKPLVPLHLYSQLEDVPPELFRNAGLIVLQKDILLSHDVLNSVGALRIFFSETDFARDLYYLFDLYREKSCILAPYDEHFSEALKDRLSRAASSFLCS